MCLGRISSPEKQELGENGLPKYLQTKLIFVVCLNFTKFILDSGVIDGETSDLRQSFGGFFLFSLLNQESRSFW